MLELLEEMPNGVPSNKVRLVLQTEIATLEDSKMYERTFDLAIHLL